MTPDKILPAGFEMSPDGTHAVFTKPIESSPNDERSYRLVCLHNDLEVLLIHDAKADKSAAALDVHVGHLSDPVRDALPPSTLIATVPLFASFCTAIRL